jgi:hypothetical protein
MFIYISHFDDLAVIFFNFNVLTISDLYDFWDFNAATFSHFKHPSVKLKSLIFLLQGVFYCGT